MTMAAAPEQLQRPMGMAAIRVVDTVLVHPSPPSPAETSLPLTFYDIFWVHTPPVQRVLFYRLAPDANVAAVLANLKRALSDALRAFFPLAGKLRLAPGAASNRYEHHYRPGDGVAFTVAECDGDVDSLSADEPREVGKLAPLAPPLPEGGALLAVQATVLRSTRCLGLAVGVTVHHAACDGAASTHFLHTWAAACAGAAQPPPPPPVIDRTLISDPKGLYDAFSQVPAPTTEETSKPVDDKLFATFVLSKPRLQRVQNVVTAESAARGVAPPPRCSSLVAAFGLIWSCYQRGGASKPENGTGKTCLVFPVDDRSRTSPPLPATYFGNCVGAAIAIASKADLATAGAAGIWAACAAAAASIEEVRSGFGMETGDLYMERVVKEANMSMLSVAGSPRFCVYELDFGFGRPAKVDIVSVAVTGAVAVAESRDGDGGVEVGVCLPPDAMAAFRKCFDDAIAGLDDAGGSS